MRNAFRERCEDLGYGTHRTLMCKIVFYWLHFSTFNVLGIKFKLGPVPVASRLICYYRSRVSISLQRSQARAIHHREARAVQSSTGARPLSIQDGFV
jgi:hypothetical protein